MIEALVANDFNVPKACMAIGITSNPMYEFIRRSFSAEFAAARQAQRRKMKLRKRHFYRRRSKINTDGILECCADPEAGDDPLTLTDI